MQANKVIRHFGGIRQTASALGITTQAVYKWGDTVPPVRQYQVEKVTRGKFKAARA